jgi:hypothetical protein
MNDSPDAVADDPVVRACLDQAEQGDLAGVAALADRLAEVGDPRYDRVLQAAARLQGLLPLAVRCHACGSARAGRAGGRVACLSCHTQGPDVVWEETLNEVLALFDRARELPDPPLPAAAAEAIAERYRPVQVRRHCLWGEAVPVLVGPEGWNEGAPLRAADGRVQPLPPGTGLPRPTPLDPELRALEDGVPGQPARVEVEAPDGCTLLVWRCRYAGAVTLGLPYLFCECDDRSPDPPRQIWARTFDVDFADGHRAAWWAWYCDRCGTVYWAKATPPVAALSPPPA